MTIELASNQAEWDSFLAEQKFRPFMQSWTMGEVYKDIGQEPIRLIANERNETLGICLAILVPARRGRHLAVPYGPVLRDRNALEPFLIKLKYLAKEHRCSFIRMSPFWPTSEPLVPGTKPSPLHLLAEHVWYLPLRGQDPWAHSSVQGEGGNEGSGSVSQDILFSSMRATTRNLVRRAEKDGVTIEVSLNPNKDIEHFLRLHDETRKRHRFTPYTNAFFRSEVKHFSMPGQCTLYLAKFQGDVIASSIHIHAFGETSYHHGASAEQYRKIPASYLLQWRAIQDALKRGDSIYNFWGITPPRQETRDMRHETEGKQDTHVSSLKSHVTQHPFAGVTLFKTGFGGKLLNLQHCCDLPVSARYYGTRLFEYVRKWRRGF